MFSSSTRLGKENWNRKHGHGCMSSRPHLRPISFNVWSKDELIYQVILILKGNTTSNIWICSTLSWTQKEAFA
ncbi:hypothetical protein HOLleu_20330 [Holothuria leucospilota]|uniref:Uncharacterized protein n=1 Tax=Holothuria leucospilota TaxID=206669 RepID=A0A9Q1C0M7_HOLLE|nr:hypothetical protein HOLleu_20330 [Holothuria leucospilota]